MLVLERSIGEQIVIEVGDGRQIVIRLTKIDHKRRAAWLGITAPLSIEIYREELAARRAQP